MVLIKVLAIKEVVIHWDAFTESMWMHSPAKHAEGNVQLKKNEFGLLSSHNLHARLLLPKPARREFLQTISCFNKWKVSENASRECAYLGLFLQKVSNPNMHPVQVWSRQYICLKQDLLESVIVGMTMKTKWFCKYFIQHSMQNILLQFWLRFKLRKTVKIC